MEEQIVAEAHRLTERASPTQMHAPDDPVRLDSLDDAALIRAYRSSGGANRSALEQLLKRHERQLFATCLRIVGDRETARDLAQDTFVRIIGAIDTFDERAKFTTWMTRIAMNGCISHLRKQKHRRGASLEAARPDGVTPRSILESAEPGPGSRVELDENLRRLARAMQTLEPEQRAILVLRDVRGLEYREIAEAMHLAIGTVKSRIFRARGALREAMEAMNDTDSG